MDYAKEKIASFKDEIEALLHEHFSSAIPNQEYCLEPQWNMYNAMQFAGNMVAYTVRDKGSLVGYASVYIYKSLYAKDRTEAQYDMIYIKPEFRKAKVGANFIRYIEKELTGIGVKQISIGSLRHQPFDNLLEWLGYKSAEVIYQKSL
jgi:GNAT superfamily N-acetyltransferase